MEKLEHCLISLKEINMLCDQIIRKSVPVMKMILNDREKYVLMLKEIYPEKDDKELTKMLQDKSIEMTRDSKMIKNQMDTFIERTFLGAEDLSETPFLTEVWSGDAYGSSGLESLKELQTDLKIQLKEATFENLWKTLKEEFYNTKKN